MKFARKKSEKQKKSEKRIKKEESRKDSAKLNKK